MAKMCLVPTAGIRSLAEKIRLAYPEACKRNGFSDQMCAEWIGLYNNINSKNPDFVPSMKSLVNFIEKLRNKEGKSFLRDLKAEERQRAIEQEMQSIKEKTLADGTFMLAPNGKKSNLTERQWLQVRTKAFKKWFGDWEKLAPKLQASDDKKLQDILQNIANSNSRFSTLAKFILDNHLSTRDLGELLIDKDFPLANQQGWYREIDDPQVGIIRYIGFQANNVPEETFNGAILHEIMHSLTQRLLKNFKENPDSVPENIRASIKDLYNIIDYSKKYILDNYNLKEGSDREKLLNLVKRQNFDKGYLHKMFYAFDETANPESKHIDEFISEIFTNPAFQEMLNSIPYKETKQTLWNKIKECIQNIFGIPINRGSVLEEALKASTEFITKAKEEYDSVSKVVDENGEPLVVYHHTDDPNLTKFSTEFENYFAKDGGTKEAIFFDEEKTGTLNRKYDLPVFLNIKELNEYNETKQQLHDRGTTYREVVNESARKNNKTGGVHMKDFDDNKKEHQSIWIIHNPNQVKSATDNNGEFSNENDSILASPQAYEEIPVEVISEIADEEVSRTAYDSVESSDSDLNKKFGDKTEIAVSELLDNLLKSDTPFREFVQALRDNIGEIGNIQVKLVPNSNSKVYGLGGLYSTFDNTIYINRNAQFKGKDGKVDNTILHEIVHAIVANSLNTVEHREELGKIFDEAKEKILKKYNVDSYDKLPEDLKNGKLYGLKNLDEFAAEFFTNSEFISELNDENTFGKRSDKKSIISRLVEWIKSLLPKGVTDTYKRSGEILEDILLNSGGTILARDSRSTLSEGSSPAAAQFNASKEIEDKYKSLKEELSPQLKKEEGRRGWHRVYKSENLHNGAPIIHINIYNSASDIDSDQYYRLNEKGEIESAVKWASQSEDSLEWKVAVNVKYPAIKDFFDTIKSGITQLSTTTAQQNKIQSTPKSTINPQFKHGIELLSGYYEGGGRLLTDDFPGVPEELDDKLNNHFMGGEELSDDDYRELAKYISVYPDANALGGYRVLPKQKATPTQKVLGDQHDDFSDILAQEEAEGRLNPSNEKNLPGTLVQTTPKPLSPSYQTALKVPSSEQKDFYTAFSPTQIVDRAKMIKNMFSDIIDETIYERREYYNDILNSSDSSDTEKENARKSLEVYNDPVLSREAAADFRGYNIIMDEIKEALSNQVEYATDPVRKQKLENTVKFFDLLSNEASKWIEEEEGIRKGEKKSADEEEQDNEDFGDNDEGNASNGNDGWVYKERFNNPFKATSKQVRRILCGIENGQTDDLGNSKTYNQGFIYSALISFLSKNLENADDFMTLVRPQDYTEDMKDSEGNTVTAASFPKGYPTFPAIEKMRIRYPWADQVIARLTNDWRAKDEDDATQLKYPPTYGAVASQFYTNFFKAFIPSAKIQVGVNPETGKPYFGTTPLNYDMEERSQRDALETAYNNGITYSDDSLYNHDKTLNNENAKKIGKQIDSLLQGEKMSYLYNAFNENNELGYPIDKEYTDQAEEILNILKAFGINVDKDNVRALILQDENASTLKGMLTDLRGIASQVERLSPEKNYFMDVVNKYGKSIWDDFFAGRGFVTEVNYMQSFYDSASKKTRYSYSADNFIQRTMRMLFSKNVSKERRQKYINDHYGRYEWFRDQSAPEGTGWKMMWLEDAYNGTFESDNLPYININSVDDRSGNANVVRDYNQWTAADKYRVMLRSWDTGSGDFAYYLAPIFADSPMSLTVKGPKYSRNQLIEGTYDKSGKYIPSGFVRLIDQELKRIKYVTETRAKAIMEGKILPITNYEKNGRKFNFMPELNEPRFSYNGVDNMTFLEVAQQIERDYEGAAAGAKEEALRNAEIAAITEILNQKYDEFLNNMPQVIIDEVAGKGGARIEDIREKLDLAYFNMVYAGVQIVQATVVDIAFSKDAVDFQKRFKQVYASGGRMNTNSLYGQKTDRVILVADEQITSPNYNNIKNIVNKAGKRLSQKDKEYILGCYTFLKDKHLDGINVSDAQALRSLSSMRSILDMYGKWNDLLEAAYHRFQEGTWDRNDFDIILQTLKPFVYSVIGRNSGVDGEQIPVPIQHKNSELVLLAMYDLISGNIRNSERLKGINRFLETVKDADGNPVANMIQYESGGKSGNQGVVNINYSHSKVMEAVQDGVISLYNSQNRLLEDQIFLDSEFKENTRENTSDNYDTIKNELTQKLIDGKISQETFNRCMRTFEPTADEVVETLTTYATILNEDGTLSTNPERVQEVPFEDYMMAQPTPPHHMDTQAPQGSQGRNIIVADLSDSFELELEGKNKEKQKLGKEKTIDFYYSLIVENLLQDYAELREIFKDNKSLRDKVMQLASSSPTYGRDFAAAFDTDDSGKFVLSPNSPTIFRKVQQLVNSVIKNHIAVQKVDGAALIQASGIGLTDDLRLVYDEDGKLVGAECYLPATSRRFFEVFTKKKTVKGQEIEILDEEALRRAGLNEAIGYRIPTENKSSMLPIIIKGFAPQQNGSAIFLPAEITVLSGSDFDVDKMFVMLSSFFVSEYRMADARKDFAKTNDMFRGLISGLLKAGNIEALEEDELENIDEEAFKKWFEKNKESYRRSKPNIYKYQYDFSKSPKQNGRKARNTMLVQIMYNILISQEGSESMFNPQNFEDLKEASKMMKIMKDPRLLRLYMEKNDLTIDEVGQSLWNASKDNLIDFVKKNDVVRSPIYPQTFDYFHDQNMAGDALLAMFALQVSAAAKFQRADITIKPKHRFSINGREIKDVDRIMNGLGEHRLKNVSQFVGGCADNGKDPNVTDYGATKNNAKVVAYMLRAGLSIKEACLVINQPEMQLPLNKLAVEIGIKNRNAWPNNNVGSETLLKNILQPEEVSPKERQDIAVMCYKIKEQAGYLGDLTSMSRADSPNGGMPETFAKARIYKYKVDLFNGRLNTYDFPFEHIDAAVSNDKINLKEDEDQIRQKLLSQKMSMLQAFYSLGVQSLDALLSPYFFMLGDKFDNMVTKRILNNLPAEMSDAQKEQIIDALYNDFITYSLSGLPLFGDENDESTLKSKRDYYLKQFPSDFRSALANNAELRDAVGNVLTADRFNRVILKDGGQLAKGQKEEIIRRIASLMYSDNEETRNIAKDLLIYSFFDNGLQFTKDSFSTMFSTQFLVNIEGYNDRLNSIEDLLDDTFVDRFIDQFANNHPEIAVSTYKKIHNTDIVSSDKIIIDKHHNQNFDNPLESKLRPYPYINHEGKIYVLDSYDNDFITYVPMSRFGNSNKLYNSNMTLQQMVTEFPYTEVVKGEPDEYGMDDWMNDLDFDPTIDPDYNDALSTREPLNTQETKTTPTQGSSSEESDSGVSDKYDNGKDQISGHMC